MGKISSVEKSKSGKKTRYQKPNLKARKIELKIITDY